MNDCILVSVLGSGQTRARYNFKESMKPLKPKRLYAIEAYHNTGDKQ